MVLFLRVSAISDLGEVPENLFELGTRGPLLGEYFDVVSCVLL